MQTENIWVQLCLSIAYLERNNGKDCVGIVCTADWTLVKHFTIDTTDAESLKWSPDGRVLAIWDSLFTYKLLLYSPDGRLVSSFCPLTNTIPTTVSATTIIPVQSEPFLGIKVVEWSPSAQFLAVGSFDCHFRLLNNITWNPVLDLDFSCVNRLFKSTSNVVILILQNR